MGLRRRRRRRSTIPEGLYAVVKLFAVNETHTEEGSGIVCGLYLHWDRSARAVKDFEVVNIKYKYL